MTKWLQGICDNAKPPQNSETEDTDLETHEGCFWLRKIVTIAKFRLSVIRPIVLPVIEPILIVFCFIKLTWTALYLYFVLLYILLRHHRSIVPFYHCIGDSI